MKKYIITTLVALTITLTGAQQTSAGTLFPTHVPGETMYSLQEIYNLAIASTTSSIGNGLPFNRPASVNGSMITLEDLYNAVFALKNASSTDDGGGDDDTGTETRTEDGRLYVSTSQDNPESRILIVDEDSKSDEQAIFAFNLEAEESDIDIQTVQIEIETGDANVSDIVSDFILEIDGEEFDDWSFMGNDYGSTTTAIIEFDIDGDYTINIDEEVPVFVLAEFKAANGTNYNSGETIKASIANEAITGEDLDDVISGGIAEGNIHELLTAGIIVELQDTNIISIGDENIGAEFEIEFSIHALEEDFYISQFASTTSDKGISFSIEGPGTPQNVNMDLDSSANEDTSGVFIVRESETQTFTLNVTVSNVDISGAYKLVLDSIFYTKNSNGISELIEKELEGEFYTSSRFIDSQN